MEKGKVSKARLVLPVLCSSIKFDNSIIDGNVENRKMYQINSMI